MREDPIKEGSTRSSRVVFGALAEHSDPIYSLSGGEPEAYHLFREGAEHCTRGACAPLRVLVSGASGFIGRRLALRLKYEFPGLDLRCLVKSDDDAFGEGGTDVLISAGLEPIFTNLVTGRGLAGIGNTDILFHLAANTHTWEPDHRCNDAGTEQLLGAIEELGPRTHVIFTSTVAVLDNRNDLREMLISASEVKAPPLSRYGVSKWHAEEFLKRKARELGFRLTILRLSTVYGPDPRPNTFFDVLKREVSRQSLLSRLNWPGLTSFIHVDDVVDCLLAAAQNPPEPERSAHSLPRAERERETEKGGALTNFHPGVTTIFEKVSGRNREENSPNACTQGRARHSVRAALDLSNDSNWRRAEGRSPCLVLDGEASREEQTTSQVQAQVRTPHPALSPSDGERVAAGRERGTLGGGLSKEQPRLQDGRIRIVLLATESLTLRDVSAMLYRICGIPFQPINLPFIVWKSLAISHGLCRWFRPCLPTKLFNFLWRSDLVVNPVFHCDTRSMQQTFPNLKPRLIARCIHQL